MHVVRLLEMRLTWRRRRTAMVKRNGLGEDSSTERVAMPQAERLEETKGHPAGDGGREGGNGDPGQVPNPAPATPAAKEAGGDDEENADRGEEEILRSGQDREAGDVAQLPETHALEISAFMSFLMVLMFVLAVSGMSGQLPWRSYLIAGGVGYVFGFAAGFLAGRTDPVAMKACSGRVPFGVEFRAAIWAVMLGFMFQDLLEGGAEVRAAAMPLLWVPPLLLPAIIMGGAIDGLLLGGIASGLPRRTPWHALRQVVSAWRQEAGARTKP